MSDEVIAGVIGGITQKKADTWTIQVTPEGSKYAKNLWTKDAELVQAMSLKIGQHGAFAGGLGAPYTVDGKEVRSWWINGDGVDAVASASVSDSPATQAPTPTPSTPAPVDWDAKELRDYRSRAWAQTISAMTHTIKVDESAADIFVRLYALQRKIYRDIVRDLDPNAFEDDDLPFS